MSEMKWQHGSTWYRVVGDLKSTKTPVMVLHGGPGAGHNYCEPIADVLAQTGRAAVLYDQIGAVIQLICQISQKSSGLQSCLWKS